MKKGSYTVEAACLMPLILMILMFALYVGEWSYNTYALRAAAVSSIIYGCDLQETQTAEADELFSTYADAYYEGQLLGNASVWTTTAYTEKGEIQVTYDLTMESPFSQIFSQLGLHRFETSEIIETGETLRPCKWIRYAKTWKEVLQNE